MLLWVFLTAVNLCVFLLYDILIEPFLYASALSLFFVLILILIQFVIARKKAEARSQALASSENCANLLPEPDTLAEKDYQDTIHKLSLQVHEMMTDFDSERQDALDYYTSWVHQIKTPIAVMKLKLTADTPENRDLTAELFRIEQYVDMVLQYVRLGSGSNDLVIQEYSLDELIKETVRKYAPQFVEKKLKLEYTPCEDKVTTDRKWFTCILDQLISNAVKYTRTGSVSIFVSDNRLTVSDTGIGIAKEDLPRIFEKGYTGNNGRIGEKSSGLGLYLAKKAADLLSVSLLAESTPGEGSRFSICLK